jgi:hypothetical protein
VDCLLQTVIYKGYLEITMIGSILLSCQKNIRISRNARPLDPTLLIRLYDGPSDNLLAVHDRVAIQVRVLPKPASYFPAAPKIVMKRIL